MEKRIIVAVALSFIVFFLYNQVINHFFPPATESNPNNTVAPSSSIDIEDNETSTLEDTEVTTQDYFLKISDQGSITIADFLAYKNPDDKGPFPFIKSPGSNHGIAAHRVWVNGALFKAKPQTTINANTITTKATSDTLDVTKVIQLNNQKFASNLSIQIVNKTSAPIQIELEVMAGAGVVSQNTIDQQYIETNWIYPTTIQHIKTFGKKKSKVSSEPISAASIKSRHFSTILKPLTNIAYTGISAGYDNKTMISSIKTNPLTLSPSEILTESMLLYIGPNDVPNLTPYGLERVVNFGKLDFICKLLIGGMQLAHSVVKNYGLAIILLTLTVNIILMPLTKVSFMSMKRMQTIQPEINKAREKYKDNPKKLNEETLELYKKHRVNPMGGCLPMLAQMPIFIALYVALSKSTELLGAKFLWVDNLAYPDKLPLPFTLPLIGDNIHILPLLMVGGMVIQQKIASSNMQGLNPEIEKQQKVMATFMPIFFGFIFYPMPSGLVLYWLTNTVFTSVYQQILRKAPASLPATT